MAVTGWGDGWGPIHQLYFGKPHPHRVWLFYVHVKRQRDKEEKGGKGTKEK